MPPAWLSKTRVSRFGRTKFFQNLIRAVSSTQQSPSAVTATNHSQEKCWKNSKTAYEKEHVTPYIKKNNFFSKYNVINKIDLSNIRLTVDYVEDLVVVKKIISQIKNKADYSLENVIKIINKDNPVISIEAASVSGWEKYTKNNMGINTFGESAPYREVYDHFKLTSNKIVEFAKTILKK